tara:strand:- start:2030 stop:2242 length:213 start_codon:yes stop_codon:yes gene_type:complete
MSDVFSWVALCLLGVLLVLLVAAYAVCFCNIGVELFGVIQAGVRPELLLIAPPSHLLGGCQPVEQRPVGL